MVIDSSPVNYPNHCYRNLRKPQHIQIFAIQLFVNQKDFLANALRCQLKNRKSQV